LGKKEKCKKDILTAVLNLGVGSRMKVVKESFRFRIDNIECLVIRDTISPMELDFLFSNIPAGQLKQLLGQYNIHSGEMMDIMCLFVRTGEHSVLIDTGWGVGSQPNSGKLIRNLEPVGISREEIDIIILSHGHPDHIGGITHPEYGFSFPNAHYFLSKKEWEFWASEPDLVQVDETVKHTMLTSVQNNLLPIQDKLTLVDNETEIVPGIKLIREPGHTPGHVVPVISSGTEHLLCTSDVIQHPLQIARLDL
jgi:glyoxylase-like metal-dependent hydrolase (beta-lactamase superfamily II)